jgi:hypothetical protein
VRRTQSVDNVDETNPGDGEGISLGAATINGPLILLGPVMLQREELHNVPSNTNRGYPVFMSIPPFLYTLRGLHVPLLNTTKMTAAFYAKYQMVDAMQRPLLALDDILLSLIASHSIWAQ